MLLQIMNPLKMIVASTLMLSIVCASAFAQPGSKAKEKVRAHKVAFLTQQLNLTPEEAQQFWPVYNEYDRKMDELRIGNRKAFKPKPGQELTEAEAQEKVDGFVRFRQQEVAVLAEYHEKFKNVLPASKVAKLYQAEEAFKRKLLEELQKRRNSPAGPQGGRPRGPQ